MSKPLNVFTLAMINVAAVSSVRNWPVIAEYGLASLFFCLLAAVIFFIPVAMVSAELATGWPKTGGVFVWVKEAFGHRWGFLAIWLLWAENLLYYPALISFISATVAYVFCPSLAHSVPYTLGCILGLFWLTTAANLMGMRLSSWISSFGVMGGTIIPSLVIIFLGALWYFSGKPLQISFDWNNLLPSMSSPREWVLFSGVLVSFCGLEMSAVHACEVENPQRNYPRALLLSAMVILGLYMLGVLAIALVVPQRDISLVAGSVQAFSIFVQAYGLNWMTPLLAVLLALGAFGTLSTWIAGPSKGLLAAAQQGDLPPIFRKLNRHKMPVALLLVQAIIVSLLSILFAVMPNINSAYWILNATLAQLYLLMYILLFAAAIRLRYKCPDTPRAYTIPGGVVGIWVVGGLGLLGSLATFTVGFFPPSQIAVGNSLFYVGFVALSIVMFCIAPSAILMLKKFRNK